MTDTGNASDDTDEQPAQPHSEASDGTLDPPTDDESASTETPSENVFVDDAADDGGDESVVTSETGGDTQSLQATLEFAALAGLALFAAVTAYGFYTNASRAISEFVAASYVSLFQAAFNLALLLVTLAGLSLLARRRFDFAG
ncbi:hypothetical protein [Halapricum desulfuricans]|uniref:Putative membrane protein n=1 Tax=Halapricum desulfuricans TaxID=2841257 RepID=A0A897N9N3_9EURY|nr:hypothetical protein [Halapricum desulfuricans]QSG09482.1 putative membrane protein [Halapricum desulfuricans]